MDIRKESEFYNKINGLRFPELQKYTICEFWEKYWGSFLCWLSKALRCADINNERIIRENWESEIKKFYKDMLKFEDTLWD